MRVPSFLVGDIVRCDLKALATLFQLALTWLRLVLVLADSTGVAVSMRALLLPPVIAFAFTLANGPAADAFVCALLFGCDVCFGLVNRFWSFGLLFMLAVYALKPNNIPLNAAIYSN